MRRQDMGKPDTVRATVKRPMLMSVVSFLGVTTK